MRFSIASRISIGFGMFAVAVLGVFLLNRSAVERSIRLHSRITNELMPEIAQVNVLQGYVQHIYALTQSWSVQQRGADEPERLWLTSLCVDTIPAMMCALDSASVNWPENRLNTWIRLRPDLLKMLELSRAVRLTLPDFDSYSDPTNQIMAEALFIPGGEFRSSYNSALSGLHFIIQEYNKELGRDVQQLNGSFDQLGRVMLYILLTVIVGSIMIGFVTIESIVRPVRSLRSKLVNLSKGIYSLHKTRTGNDEIGDMAVAVDILINNFEKTKEFTIQIGEGNFEHAYSPLSEHDEMGKALLKMRDELNSYRHEMESKVSEQTIEIRRQKDEVNEQRLKVLNLYNDLQASIDYALKIQQTILPTDQYVKECFPESFVLYQPKATVSGDFYWCASKGSKRMLAAADCTGHGVPGAFMSLVGYNAFNQAVKVFLKPAQVMNSVNRFSVKAMRAEGLEQGLKDGMDVAFISYDIDTRELLFAAAKNSGFVARQGEMITLEADSFSVGAHYAGEKEFSQCSMTMESGDTLYLFSDGFADQFGGPDGKKFMRRRFKELLLESSKLGIEEQQEFIQKTYAAWQGDLEQVDDVMVIGIRF